MWGAGYLQVWDSGPAPSALHHLQHGHLLFDALWSTWSLDMTLVLPWVGWHWPLSEWQTCYLEFVTRLPLPCSLALEDRKLDSMSGPQYISVREPSLVPRRAISFSGLRHCSGRISRRFIFPSANIPLSPNTYISTTGALAHYCRGSKVSLPRKHRNPGPLSSSPFYG